MPGVQMPHCAAPWATKARCRFESAPSAPARPSTVVTVAAFALADGDDAGAHLLAVEQHRAGAAVAGVAADLGAGQAELVAQRVGEPPRRIADELALAAVDLQADDLPRCGVARGHGAYEPRARASRVRVASRR